MTDLDLCTDLGRQGERLIHTNTQQAVPISRWRLDDSKHLDWESDWRAGKLKGMSHHWPEMLRRYSLESMIPHWHCPSASWPASRVVVMHQHSIQRLTEVLWSRHYALTICRPHWRA